MGVHSVLLGRVEKPEVKPLELRPTLLCHCSRAESSAAGWVQAAGEQGARSEANARTHRAPR